MGTGEIGARNLGLQGFHQFKHLQDHWSVSLELRAGFNKPFPVVMQARELDLGFWENSTIALDHNENGEQGETLRNEMKSNLLWFCTSQEHLRA